MDREELKRRMARDWGCEPDDKTRGYSSRLVRCGCGRHAHVAVACGKSAVRLAKDFGGAISWYLQVAKDRGPLRFIVGSDADGKWRHAVEAIAMLVPETGPVDLQVDFQPARTSVAGDLTPPGWIDLLMKVGEEPPPPWALEVERLAASVGFRWQRTVSGGEWSGRLEGLEICKVADAGTGFSFGVGKAGKLDEETGERNVSKARIRFAEIMRDHVSRFGALDDAERLLLRAPESQRAAEVVLALSAEHLVAHGSAEHRFESQVNQGRRVLIVDGAPLDLTFPQRPFQYPTRWWAGDSARYVDVLGRRGTTPWVVELKVDDGQGEYYRDGIVQAALYREYVRRASRLERWCEKHRLERTACRAALVIPPLRGPDAAELESDHRAVAEQLGVTLETCAPTKEDLACARLPC
jgi:hypothetical protein